MAATFRGTRTLRFLWYLQRGFCPVCNMKITQTSAYHVIHMKAAVYTRANSGKVLEIQDLDSEFRRTTKSSYGFMALRSIRWTGA
jgi:hypothetical protein